jgi:peptidyl-prolyl cis-trans isomerase D
MFNLFRSRDKAVRYLLGGLLLLVAASMVTYLIPGYSSTTGTSTNDTIVAEIGNEKLTTQEVQQTLERFMNSGQLPREMAELYLPRFLDQMIRQRALVYEFSRMGLTVSDDEVYIGLMSEYPNFFQNGQLASQEQFEQALAQQGMTLQETIDNMRRQLVLRKVQNMALAGVVVTPQEVQEALIRKDEKAKVSYVAFPPAKFRDQVKATPDDVRKTFDSHRAEYTIPEKLSFQVLVVDQTKVEESLAVSDAQVRARYSTSMDNFRMPERVHARHILLKTTGKSDAEKKALQAKAQDLLKQLKAGADFADLAQKNSEDTGTGQRGGDLGWVVRGQTVPEFEKTVFSLKPKEMSNVVTTEYGYHMVQVLEKEPARVKPFEEVKADLIKELKSEGVNDKMQSTADQVRAALEKSPGSAAQIAKQFNVELVTVTKGNPKEAIPTLGVSPEIDNALASMKNNEVSQVLALPANRLAVVLLTDRIATRPEEFDEVEDKVRDRVIMDKAQLIAADKAKDAAERLRAGEDMDKLAKSMKLEVVTSTEFGHNDAVEGIGSSTYVEDAFTKPVGTILGPLDVQGRKVVCKVVAKQAADPAKVVGQRDAVVSEIKQKKAVEQNDLFLDSVLTKLVADGQVKIHRDAIKTLTAAFKR